MQIPQNWSKFRIVDGPLLQDPVWAASPYLDVGPATKFVRMFIEENGQDLMVEYRADHTAKELRFRRKGKSLLSV